MRFAFGMMLISVMYLPFSYGADASCANLNTQLSQMHRAQIQLLNSFISKNETVAASFEAFAERLKKTPGAASQASLKAESHSLSQSAQAFRLHKVRESELVNKFEEVSQDLIRKVQSCLAQSDKSRTAF